jgi:hypothetical protein
MMPDMASIVETRSQARSGSVRASGGVTCRFHPDSGRTEMLALWREIEQQVNAPPLLCSADWTEVWLQHFGAIIPHRFAVLCDAGVPFAVALIAHGSHDRDGLAAIHARHVGTAGEPDEHSVCIEYNALMCDPARREAAWTSLIGSLDCETDWDELRLDGFAAEDLEGLLNDETNWQWTRKPARFVDLDKVRRSGRELVTFFGDSTRKGIRQNLRHYGDVAVEWATTADHAADIFNDLIVLHQERWRAEGKPGCYASSVFTAFHRDVLARLVPQGRLALFRVRSGGVTLGCSQLLIDRGRVLLYQGGRLAGNQKQSPGLVNDYLAMHESLSRGYRAFDFMAGDSIHKQRLTTHTTDLVWGVRRRPRLKFAVMSQLRQVKHWLRAMQGET